MFSLMGNCISSIKQNREPRKELTLAVFGLDGAGKTTISKCLLGDSLETAPTVGFNNEKVTFGRYELSLFDVGGGKKIRDIWKNYFGEVYGIIYVVDSTMRDRFTEVGANIKQLLCHSQIKGKPILFFANKQDLGGALKEDELSAKLDVEHEANVNQCPSRLVACSAIKGTGRKMDKNISLGLKWLCAVIDDMYSKLKVRIDEDMRVEAEKQKKENMEKRERVRKMKEERERKEEEERKLAGEEEPKHDTDDDDIVVGDPFKKLDYNELDKKDKKMKEEKKKKKKDYQYTNGNNNGNNNGDLGGLGMPMSNRSLDSYGLSRSGYGGTKDESSDEDLEDDFLKIPTPARLTSILPPIQKPIGSKQQNQKKYKANHKVSEKLIQDLKGNGTDEETLGESFTMSNKSSSSITRIHVSTLSPASSEENVSKGPGITYNALDADIDSSGLSPGSTPRDGETGGKRKKKKKRFLREVRERELHKNMHRDEDEFRDSVAATSNTHSLLDTHHRVEDNRLDHANGFTFENSRVRSQIVRTPKHFFNGRLSPSDGEIREKSSGKDAREKPHKWTRNPSRNPEDNIITDVSSAMKWNFAEDLPTTASEYKPRFEPNKDDDDIMM
ncbi:hypothetical protein ScPMuIL_012682 [Solemya velum]